MKSLLILLIITCSSCSLLQLRSPTNYDYMYKYVELPDTTTQIGYSNELFTPCDTVTEFPSGRQFVVKAVKLTKETKWLNCPK